MPTKRKKPLTASLEDYLEAILRLAGEGVGARAADIAKLLRVGKSAVTAALKTLASRGLVVYEPYHPITLTDKGQQAAEEIRKRHRVVRGFLEDVLGIEAETAEANACRIEHAIDAEVLSRLDDFVEHCHAEHLESHPRAGHSPAQCGDAS
jgi:DtxR family Mn-dependent transcriptional regulator